MTPKMMRAAVKQRPEPGLQVVEWPVPQPGPGEVLVRVQAAAICGTDVHLYDWTPYAQARLKPPQPIGHEFAGEIVAVGEGVAPARVGDLVAGETHYACFECVLCKADKLHICQNMLIFGVHTPGAFAEYTVLPDYLARSLPSDFTPELGALLESLGVAVHGALAGPVEGRTAAVFGCGPIGCFAIDVLRASGAARILATDVRQTRLDLARQLGATETIDVTAQDPVAAILDATGGLGVDLTLEISGVQSAINQALKSTRKAGRVTFIGLPSGSITIDDFSNDVIYKELQIGGITGREMFRTWDQSIALLQAGKIDPRQVLTHRFPLERAAEAIELTRSGHAGKVMILP
jgi:threonine 3-dehydrogenase